MIVLKNESEQSMEAAQLLRVSHGKWRMEMLPEDGGRVTWLDFGGSSNWLAQSDRLGSNGSLRWLDGDTRGWDECFPSIAPTREAQNKDHGDLWSARTRSWWSSPLLTTEYPANAVNGQLRRQIHFEDTSVSVEYHLTSHLQFPCAFIWAMHLLLDLHAQDLLLPLNREVQIESTFGDIAELLPGRSATWEEVLSALRSSSRSAIKCFLPLPSGEPIRFHIDGQTVELTVTATFATYLGIWANCDGWPKERPLHHLGVEPTFADVDSLDRAKAEGKAPTIDAANPLEWVVKLSIISTTEENR